MSHFVFECNSDTYLDCMSRQVFASNKPWPLQVAQGDYCLLHHFETGVLLGLWMARTNGGRNLVPKLWAGRFPFQVMVDLVVPRVIEVPRQVLLECGINPASGRFDGLLEDSVGEGLTTSLLGAPS
jgi:hypothetical protein